MLIPSALKEHSVLKDSLIFSLGQIDDFDQVFLNGYLIGENLKTMPPGTSPSDAFKNLINSFWNKQRRYTLAIDDARIKWDAENVLAIRVFYWGGAGGIFSWELKIAMLVYSDYVEIKNNAGWFKITADKLQKEIQLKNKSGRYTIDGTLEVEARSNIDRQ